jgi:hypothetical protein
MNSQVRILTNPDIKVELPAGFPAPMPLEYARFLRSLLRAELDKQGVCIDEVKRITIAYPHKDARLHRHHPNSATRVAHDFAAAMRGHLPEIEWILASGIVETKKLNRTNRQNSVHALTQRQIFAVDTKAQKEPLPFLDVDNKEKEFFVIVDSAIEQGTIVADLMSYIHHNGGLVLTVLAHKSYANTLSQQNPRKISYQDTGLVGVFADASRNTARLPEMAKIFAASAQAQGHDMTPQQCLDLFEETLNSFGNSVFALTDTECERVINYRTEGWQFQSHFLDFIEELKKEAQSVPNPAPRALNV